LSSRAKDTEERLGEKSAFCSNLMGEEVEERRGGFERSVAEVSCYESCVWSNVFY